jgi:hypothetical protein
MGASRVYWRHGARDWAANHQVSGQPRLSGKDVLTLEGRADKRNGPSNTPGTRILPRMGGALIAVGDSIVSERPPEGFREEEKKKS